MNHRFVTTPAPRDHPLLMLYQGQPPLQEEPGENRKDVLDPPAKAQSSWYQEFRAPFRPLPTNGYDIHVYYQPGSANQRDWASALREVIRREFPELRTYGLWKQPVGPHPVPFFEVNIDLPSQLGAIVGFLTVNRGPLSVLIHPNTRDEHRDHAELGFWLGQPYPLNLELFEKQ